MIGALLKRPKEVRPSSAVAFGAEIARSRSEAPQALPVAREQNTRNSRTDGNRASALRNISRSSSRRAIAFMISIPLQFNGWPLTFFITRRQRKRESESKDDMTLERSNPLSWPSPPTHVRLSCPERIQYLEIDGHRQHLDGGTF